MPLQKNDQPRAILACGGWAHPPDEVREPLVEILHGHGFDVVVIERPAELTATLADACDLLVVASCWFSMTQDRYTPEQRDEWAVPADLDRQQLLGRMIDEGTPVLALHTAVICFDQWPGWKARLGGGWNWQYSNHPAPARITVTGCERQSTGIQIETFTVVDEEYCDLDVSPESEVVARSEAGHPVMWLSHDEGRRVAVDVLGHDRRSLDNVGHRAAIDALLKRLLEPAHA